MDIVTTAKEMFKNQSLDDYDIDVFVAILTKADDFYYNDDESFLTDTQYDFLRRYAEKNTPSHVYFTGVGSSVRGGKVKLPHELGSLDQIYEGEIGKWIKKYALDQEPVVLTDKLDGASAMLIYDGNGDLQIGYSRGDGILGADWYRHLCKLQTVPKNIGKPMAVRGEVIFETATFPFLRSKVMNRAGKPYKNPRNMVSGLMNAKKNDKMVYNYIRFVAYQIIDGDGSKQSQLRELDALGFKVVHSLCVYGKELNDIYLSNYLNLRRQNSRYEIDGLVIDVDREDKRKEMNPMRETLNPAYAIKYKVAAADNIAVTTVLGVDWNISKHGYLKPRVNIKPVNIGGVTIEWASGFNAKFIRDNNIGRDAVIEITRAGDVIPFIQSVITGAVPEMPQQHAWDWDWTTNDAGEKVDAVLKNPDMYEEVAVKRNISFFNKIDAPMLKEGNIQKLYNAGYKDVTSIVNASSNELIGVLGENGKKAYTGLRDTLTDIPLYKIMGAYSTQRGIGVRKMKKLQKFLGRDHMYTCNDVDVIANVEGFDIKTAKRTVIAISKFIDFFSDVCDFVTIAEEESTGSLLANEKICMTGFRDKALVEQIENAGGTIQSGVSGKTTIVIAKDPSSNSGKIKKARDAGIRIMGIVEFDEFIKGG